MVGKREDHQMIVHGGSANRVSALGCEFEMVGLLGMSEDAAIEAVVVFKLGEYREAQPCGIHLRNGFSMVRWSGNTEHRTSLHRSASLFFMTPQWYSHP